MSRYWTPAFAGTVATLLSARAAQPRAVVQALLAHVTDKAAHRPVNADETVLPNSVYDTALNGRADGVFPADKRRSPGP